MPLPNNYAKQTRCTKCAVEYKASAKRANRRSAPQVRHEQKARASTRGIKEQTFVGFDGEGMSQILDWDDEMEYWSAEQLEAEKDHRYNYMAAADTNGSVESLECKPGKTRLYTNDILWWLYKVGRKATKDDPSKSLWFYSAKYDWTHIFRDIAIKDREILHQIFHADQYPDGTMRDPFTPVRWGRWGIVYVQGSVKIMRFYTHKAEHSEGCKPTCKLVEGDEYSGEVFFQDAFKCFGGGSFVSQLEAWDIGTPEQRERIKGMKDKRSHFVILTDEVRQYCIEEVQLLAELAQKVVGTFAEMGIRPKGGRWYSAGSAAKALLRVHRIPSETDKQGNVIWDGFRGPDRYAGAPEDLIKPLLAAYYGGRFENAETGYFEELHSEDFKSAYPAVIKTLPCLAHGHWERNYVEGQTNFGHVRWENTDDYENLRWGPFTWRWPEGRIYYPSMGVGWYCETEINSARKLSGYSIEVDEWFCWVQECDHVPFEWVQEVYDLRVQLGGDGKGIVLKVTLNSIYGTFADTLSLDSPYASIVWASMITAGCRAKLLDELAWRGDKIVSIATDGILTTEKSPVAKKTKVLGELNYEGVITDVLLIQPGVYLAGGGDDLKKQVRNRGHALKDLREKEAELREAWARDGWDAEVPYERTRLIPGKLALTRKDPLAVYGQWLTEQVTIKFKPSSREISNDTGPRRRSHPSMRHLVIKRNGKLLDEESSAYDKMISMRYNEELIMGKEVDDAQP